MLNQVHWSWFQQMKLKSRGLDFFIKGKKRKKKKEKEANSQTLRFLDSRKTLVLHIEWESKMFQCLYSCLSEGSKEMDVLRDAMAKRFGEQVTKGQRNKEWSAENRSGVVSNLDPKPLSQSSFVNHRHDWTNSSASYHRWCCFSNHNDGFAAISQRFKKRKRKWTC